MSEKQKTKKTKEEQVKLVDRSITISTPRVTIQIETKCHSDCLSTLKKMAEEIIDKYTENHKERNNNENWWNR